MAYLSPAVGAVTLASVNSATFTGAVEDAYYGFAYNTMKTAALESANTDGFWIKNDASMADLYVKTGASTYITLAAAAAAAGTDTANIVIRGTGIYADNVKISNYDIKVYWLPPANANGVTAAFTTVAVDNVNGIWGDADISSLAAGVVVNVTLAAVNDIPVAALTLTSAAATEGGALNLMGAGLSVSDADGANGAPGATVANATVTLTVGNGTTNEGVLGVTAGTGVTVNSNTGGVLVLQGTFAALDAFLKGNSGGALTYTNSAAVPVANETLSLVANDTLANSVLVSTTINITPVNSMPVNTVPGAQAVVANVATITGISIADADAAGANVQTALSVDVGTLTVTLSGAATISAGTNGSGALTLLGTVTDINNTLAAGVAYAGAGGTLSVVTNDLGNSGGVPNITAASTVALVSTAAVASVDAVAGSYKAGGIIDIVVTYSGPVTVDTAGGTPTVAFNMDNAGPLDAVYDAATSTTTALHFLYTVQALQTDVNGISITPGSIVLNGGTIVNAVGGAPVSVALNNILPTLDVLVDTTTPAAPVVALTTDSALADGTPILAHWHSRAWKVAPWLNTASMAARFGLAVSLRQKARTACKCVRLTLPATYRVLRLRWHSRWTRQSQHQALP